MRNYKPEDGRNAWTKEDDDLLRSAYKKYPISYPDKLVKRHGKSGCQTRAYRLKISKGIRNPGVDLSSLTPEEVGYIAGFMDGEGSIIFYPNKRKKNPTIQFPNTNRECIEWLLRKLTVGGLSITHRSRREPHYKDIYQIHIGGVKNVYDILVKIYPHLIIKREKARLAIEMIESHYGITS